MKFPGSFALTAFLFFFSAAVLAQTPNPNYDSTLAAELGGDDYGMKKYVLVILKTGSNTDSTIRDSCFTGHMANMEVLVEQGKLVVAGPIGKNDKQYRGIFILNLNKLDDARTLLATDPAIKEKFLEPELYIWYGSAALPVYLDASDKIWKEKP